MSIRLITTTMQDCPKWDNCNAPICPADKDWKLRKHFKDDPTCFYLREVAKSEHRGEPISERRSDPMLIAAADVWAKRDSLATPLRNQLLRASTSGSKSFATSDRERLAA